MQSKRQRLARKYFTLWLENTRWRVGKRKFLEVSFLYWIYSI